MDGLEDELAFAHVLADAADAITRAAFVAGGEVDHRLKPDGTPVSDTDRSVEERLLALVREHRPGAAFLGEEVGPHGSTAARCWVVDGIDGTADFVRGLPSWGTLVALVEDDVPVLGVNSSPAEARRWWASSGGGAWTAPVEGERVRDATRLEVAAAGASRRLRANVELAWPTHPLRPTVDRLAGRVETVTMTTHPALMVASGEIDLAVALGGGPWDFAALMVIVREAGGRCLDLAGDEAAAAQPPMIYTGAIARDRVRQLVAP